MLFGVENAKTVVGSGVFFIEIEDGEEGFLGTKGLVVAHRGLGGIPKLLHLHVITGGMGSIGGLAPENWIEKSDINCQNKNKGDT